MSLNKQTPFLRPETKRYGFHTFELSHEALSIISDALEQVRLLDARVE